MEKKNDSDVKIALVVGATGIAGNALVDQLLAGDWRVLALSRNPQPHKDSRVTPLAVDLCLQDRLVRLQNVRPTHVFFVSWLRQETEKENIRVNAGMLQNLLTALQNAPLRHVALLTGMKHYMGPFEAYGRPGSPDTPFHEDAERLPYENFYYAQEDILFEAAAKHPFSWSVHRSHSLIGYAVGNAMNMGLTLAVYAAICRELDHPFVFPGSKQMWNGITNITDSTLNAEHMIWAATSEHASNKAFNIVNSDVFRWRWLWPRLAKFLGVKPEAPSDVRRPLVVQMKDAQAVWDRIVQKHRLVERDLSKLASWWHTDADLGLEVECFADMTRSRNCGFYGFRDSEKVFLDTFQRYMSARLVPTVTAQD